MLHTHISIETPTYRERHFGRALLLREVGSETPLMLTVLPPRTDVVSAPNETRLETGLVRVQWRNERCPTCRRVIQVDEQAWFDAELEAVFCTLCFEKWREDWEDQGEHETVEKPHVRELLRARMKADHEVGKQLTISEEAHLKNVIGSLDHVDYLRTPIWLGRAARFIDSRGPLPSCELCFARSQWTGGEHVAIDPVVHHKNYANKGYELDEDLALLCVRCHVLIHFPDLARSKAQMRKLLKRRSEEEVAQAIYAVLPGPQG
jgi:hypothetical protein